MPTPVKRLRRKEVAQVVGWSLSTLRDKLYAGQFIEPTYEGKIPFWLSTDVEQWINEFFKRGAEHG